MSILIDENTCVDSCTVCDFFCPGDIIYCDAKDEAPVVKYQDAVHVSFTARLTPSASSFRPKC